MQWFLYLGANPKPAVWLLFKKWKWCIHLSRYYFHSLFQALVSFHLKTNTKMNGSLPPVFQPPDHRCGTVAPRRVAETNWMRCKFKADLFLWCRNERGSTGTSVKAQTSRSVLETKVMKSNTQLERRKTRWERFFYTEELQCTWKIKLCLYRKKGHLSRSIMLCN